MSVCCKDVAVPGGTCVPAGRRARRRFYPHFRLASKPQAPCRPRAARGQSPRHHEASDGNGAFARTVSSIPGPSTRMAAATSATSRVSMNVTPSSPACPPRLAARAGGSRSGPCPRARARPQHRSCRPTPGAGPGTGRLLRVHREHLVRRRDQRHRPRAVISFDPDPHLAVTGILTQQAANQLVQLRDPGNAIRQPPPGQHRRGPVHHLGRADSSGFLTLPSDGLWLTGAYALGPEAGEWLQQAMPSGPPPVRHAARRQPAVSPLLRGLRRRSEGAAQRDHGRAAPGRCWCSVTCGGGPDLCPECDAGE